jgi:Tfp pilus assembly protein FimT
MIRRTIRGKYGVCGEGFTILELLIVMGIMVIMASVGLLGFFGSVRGIAARSAAMHLSQTISLARQNAIILGKRVYIMFGREGENYWYSMVSKEGSITYDSAGGGATPGALTVGDDFGELSSLASNCVIYNLSRRDSSTLQYYTGMVTDVRERLVSGNLMWIMQVVPDVLRTGDDYGWEIMPKNLLPRGNLFNEMPEPIVFAPEGWPLNLDGTRALNSSYRRIQIVEAIAKDSANRRCVQVDVRGITGIADVNLNAGY